MLPSETMIWQPEFTDKILSRKPGAVHIFHSQPQQNSFILRHVLPCLTQGQKHKTSLGANKRGFYFYSLTFRQFAGFRVIRPRGHSSFFSKIFCLSVDTPARQRALLVTTGYLTVTVV
ncbi:hypothetical protein GJ599_24260 [Escherichia coli]|nr:hypothetical protein [Escherichia coli]